MQVPQISTMDAGFSEKQRTAKLADGAHQFEAMMLQQMLKPLNFGATPDAEEGSQDTLQSYGTEALAKAISGRGGFGMADRIIKQVTAEDAAKTGGGKEAKVK